MSYWESYRRVGESVATKNALQSGIKEYFQDIRDLYWKHNDRSVSVELEQNRRLIAQAVKENEEIRRKVYTSRPELGGRNRARLGKPKKLEITSKLSNGDSCQFSMNLITIAKAKQMPEMITWVPIQGNVKVKTIIHPQVERRRAYFDSEIRDLVWASNSDEEREANDNEQFYVAHEDYILYRLAHSDMLRRLKNSFSINQFWKFVSRLTQRPQKSIKMRLQQLLKLRKRIHPLRNPSAERMINDRFMFRNGMNEYRKLFCRRCLKYACDKHDQGQEFPMRDDIPEINTRGQSSDICKYTGRSFIEPKDLQDSERELIVRCILMSRERNPSTKNSDSIPPSLFCLVQVVLRNSPRLLSIYNGLLEYNASAQIPQQHKVTEEFRVANTKICSSLVDSTLPGTFIEYKPCYHPRYSCDDKRANCRCQRLGLWCEKYCSCLRSCRFQYPGCNCKGKCDNKGCLCIREARDCDPDICKGCFDISLQTDPALPSEPCKHPPSSNSSRRRRKQPRWKMNSACSNCDLLLEKHERLLLGVSRVSGWGIFAHSEIKRGSLIAEYRGELISHAEADRRGKVYDIVNKSYLFNLSDQQVMDGFRFSNKTRFSNNSKTHDNCEPMGRVCKGDIRMAIVAKKNIRVFEEIMFDYRYDRTTENCPDFYKPSKRPKTS